MERPAADGERSDDAHARVGAMRGNLNLNCRRISRDSGIDILDSDIADRCHLAA
jgi:hypothetical protein